ncbi:MAG: DNA-directed RNA polymerase subunit H [Nitrososphaerota archaeon]|nr:DNA-directed RNA polymerase subunit H [Candidatus Bathyarchaeota archaeon]MDW8049061.1 DNA-directed RNA polymerase subunit H [Nitrososphaerota archaeon]
MELVPPNFPSFDIFEHFLVPKHEILSPEEKEEVLKKYKVEPYQLPLIKVSDPIAKVIGARVGDLVKITRKSPTAGEYISYRYVVEG